MTNTPSEQDPIQQRLNNIENRLERMDGEFREQTATLFDGLVALSQQTTNLANRMDQLTEVMVEFARNAEADRAIMRQNQAAITENQTEIRRIWEYLLGQSSNGQRG